MKVATILGARPQFIKASVVSAALDNDSRCEEIIIHTGQHFDANMSEIFFSELGIKTPDYNLEIHSGNHGAMTGRMLIAIEDVLLKEKPDVVLVYGDTNSTLAGALAATKLHIPVAHVEAGLRSFNMHMPEEINRILTDRISAWLFTPTADAVKHLQNEGFTEERISHVGDVMYDVALHYGKRSELRDNTALSRLSLNKNKFILMTVHRAENTDNAERFKKIILGLCEVAKSIKVVWPLHPRALNALKREGLYEHANKHLHLVEPLGYLDMIELEKNAAVIATDSGGVQKEAFFHGTPCITLRDETEWNELVAAGWNRLIMLNDSSVEEIADYILSSVDTKGLAVKPYGNGNASELIVKRIMGQ